MFPVQAAPPTKRALTRFHQVSAVPEIDGSGSGGGGSGGSGGEGGGEGGLCRHRPPSARFNWWQLVRTTPVGGASATARPCPDDVRFRSSASTDARVESDARRVTATGGGGGSQGWKEDREGWSLDMRSVRWSKRTTYSLICKLNETTTCSEAAG